VASEEENGEWYAGLPANMQAVLEGIPFVVPADEDEARIYARGQTGHCMTCNAELGDDTMIVLASTGLLFVACGGACLTDMQVIGWLQEQFKDISDRVQFRGGGADEES
jgi:hypothetical protein